ncbi:NUDIX hydrolase [Pseudomonadota bacterium]|nr:NUDIX hydrolase [Pseudomonadota bacterium]
MRYCSKCGSDQIDFKVPVGDNIKRYVCSACDSIFYTNPNLIVGTICIKDDQILLCKRNIEPRFGLWTLPAGFMENSETLQEGALRETKEETQASPKIIAPYSAFSLTHISQVHFFYLADLGNESFGPTSESSAVELFDEKDIPWDQIAFPTVTKTLKYYFEDRKNGDFPFREEALKLW